MKKNLKELEEQLKQNPNDIPLKIRYAGMLLAEGKYRNAEKVYQLILDQDKSNTQAKSGLVKAYYQLKNFSAVIVVAEELEAKKQSTEEIKTLHIKALLRQNSINEAHELYQNLIEENPFIFDQELLETFEQDNQENKEDEFYLEPPYDDDFDDDEDFDDFDEELHLERITEMFENLFVIRNGRLSFDDIIGMKNLKNIFRHKFSFFNQEGNLYEQNARKQRASLLIYGPPGCGKTFIMNAFINEFYCPLIQLEIINPGNVPMLNKQNIVDMAFNHAVVIKPTTIFIDHLEAFAPISDQGTPDITTKVLQCFDSLRHDFEGIGFIGVTSKPWEVSPEIIRYKRLDEAVYVGPPDDRERTRFFKLKLKQFTNIPLSDYKTFITNTANFSYAELEQVIDKAIYYTSIDKKSDNNLSSEHVGKAIQDIKPYFHVWREELRRNLEGNPVLKYHFGIDEVQ